jgi:glycosyltransferase involved in cell wall biosynthesis
LIRPLSRFAARWRRPAPAVSVVVPTFNCAPYLPRAIDSVLAQEGVSVELLVVDDGSTDDTRAVLAARYGDRPEVRVLRHEVNRNQGAARNTGLDAARGEHVFFLDADDWIDPGALRRLTELAAESGAEVVACGARLAFPDGRTEPFHAHAFACAGGREALRELVAYRIGSIVWDKLYRRDFLEGHRLRFVDSIKEDVIFSIEATYVCRHFRSTDEVFCNYFQREDSCIRGTPTIRHLESFIQVYVDIARFVERTRLDGDAEGATLTRDLFRAHGSADLYPKLVRYVRSRPREQWEAECWTACRRLLGAGGHAVADVLVRTMQDAMAAPANASRPGE